MRLSFIGAGKMAEAMIAAILRAKLASPSEIFVSDVSTDRRNAVKKQHGINVYASNTYVVEMAPTIFLAVKPQDLDAVLKEIAPGVTHEHLVISIAAGKKVEQIETAIPRARVIRVMPNVASLVSEGMSVFAVGSKAQEGDRFLARKLLSCFGKVLELGEDRFDAVTALSGSGPAFFSYLLIRLVDAAVSEGLERSDALLLATQTMLGTARMLVQEQISPEELIARVKSPKGTTAAGLDVLDASPVGDVLAQTIRAAARRSRELSR